VIPADNKWFARLAVSESLCAVMERLGLRYPAQTPERRSELQEIRRKLEVEAKPK